MKVNVSGGIQVGESLPKYVEDSFVNESTKLFENIPVVEVRFKKEGNQIFTSIVVNDVFKKGVKITAEAEDIDARRSFDEAFKKIFVQIRKEKDKAVTKKKTNKK